MEQLALPADVLPVHGVVALSALNRQSLQARGMIELETKDREELALERKVFLNGMMFSVVGRSRAGIVPGSRVNIVLKRWSAFAQRMALSANENRRPGWNAQTDAAQASALAAAEAKRARKAEHRLALVH